ncbi:hypothetical protein [Pseudorhizobium marinum]|uniref:hypothetical protein n=1 Tax=Pseudorhizobium marinum TaxID=1496690 RepID=UPI00056D4133|nr:hypothetical protein [Pseudorhizobium marinum]
MTFSEAYDLYGPDTIAISEALDIPEHEADRFISAEMDRRRQSDCIQRRREYNGRLRTSLRDLRARRPA